MGFDNNIGSLRFGGDPPLLCMYPNPFTYSMKLGTHPANDSSGKRPTLGPFRTRLPYSQPIPGWERAGAPGYSILDKFRRFSIIADVGELARRFGFDGIGLSLEPPYNIAPTQQALTVLEGGEGRQPALVRWGLIPSWARDPSIGARMINARAETIAEKPSFRTALRRRRCLVLADGFYEWQKVPGSRGKRPMRIVMRTGEPFAFAGLWEAGRDPAGQVIPSCTIITTGANELLAPIHHRMPVILPREAESLWLDTTVDDPGLLEQMLGPYDADQMDAYEVSTLVNSAANNTPQVVEPVERAGGQTVLLP